MAQSNQITQQLEAAQAFLVVMLAESAGSLNELQREFLASTLTQVQRAEALLWSALADTEASREQPAIRKPASSLPG